VHVGIVAYFIAQLLYVSYQVFVVLSPPGHVGPAFGRAAEMPFEQLVARRLYAIEGWIAFVGLALYLAVIEIVPRMWLDED
jgi:hypothetical protein